MTKRLFIGLELPEEVREAVSSSARVVQENSVDGRYEQEDKYHITLYSSENGRYVPLVQRKFIVQV